MAGLTGWHLVIILVIVLLLFGATRLPALARSIGQSVKVFKTEVKPEAKPGDDTTSAPVDSTESAQTSSKPTSTP